MPLAVVGSNVVVEVNGKKVRGRQYPWGVAEGMSARLLHQRRAATFVPAVSFCCTGPVESRDNSSQEMCAVQYCVPLASAPSWNAGFEGLIMSSHRSLPALRVKRSMFAPESV